MSNVEKAQAAIAASDAAFTVVDGLPGDSNECRVALANANIAHMQAKQAAIAAIRSLRVVGSVVETTGGQYGVVLAGPIPAPGTIIYAEDQP